MFKILKIFLLLLFLTPAFLYPSKADAFSCSLLYTSPQPLVAPSGRNSLGTGLRIQYNISVDEPGSYNVYLRRGHGAFGDISFRDLTPNTSNILVNSSNQPPDIVTFEDQVFDVGPHTIEVEQNGVSGNNVCTATYEILPSNEGQQVQTCSQISRPSEANTNTDIIFSGTLLPEGRYRFFIPSSNQEVSFTTDNSGQFSVNFGRLASSTYQIKLQKWVRVYVPGTINKYTNQWQDTNCSIQDLVVNPITVNPSPNTSAVPVGSGAPAYPGAIPSATPCTDPDKCTKAGGSSCSKDDPSRGPGFKTAIGCIHTSPVEFTKDALKFLLGIGGGFAFLMMLLGAFQMLTSAGNPETLQAGRERLTSAIIGLLFVIFAVLLMQIIGVDILKLPDFNR